MATSASQRARAMALPGKSGEIAKAKYSTTASGVSSPTTPKGFSSQAKYDTFYNKQNAKDQAKLTSAGYTAPGLANKSTRGNNATTNIDPMALEPGYKAPGLANKGTDISTGPATPTTPTTPINNGYGKFAPADQTERNKKAMEEISKSGLTIEQYLKEQKGRDTASAEDQKKTTDEMHRLMSEDVVGNVAAADAIELQKKTNEEISFAQEQHDRQLQIDRLTDANNGIARSENLDKATQQLDALKQSIAYLGTMGMPGVSSVHLDAISKQMDSAQTTYNRLVATQNNQKAAEAIGNEYNAKAFEKSITDLQYALSQQIGEATQNAINMLQANGNEIDTIEELNTVKGTMMQELDKAVANIAISNATQRKQIVDSYNTNIAKGELWAKNALVVNEAVSKATGFYIDGNGQKMVTPDGQPIVYVPDPIYAGMDSNGNFVQITQNADGSLKRVESKGSKAAGRLTTEQILSISKEAAAQGRTMQQQLEFMGLVAPTPTAKPVDKLTVQKALDATETTYKDGSYGGQCGAFANNYAEKLGLGRIFKDPFTQKDDYINSTEPTVGSFAMWQPEGSEYGHVGMVVGINGDNLLIKDSNGVKGKDGKYNETVATRTVSKSKILAQNGGFFDPTQGLGSSTLSDNTAVGGEVYNTLPAEDKSQADMIANYEAPLPSSRVKNYSKIIAAAKEINPEFDVKKYPAQQKFLNNWTSGLMNTNKLALNTALGHIGTLMDATENISTGKFKPLNQAKNWIADITGNPNLASAKVDAYAVASEIAKVFKGGASPTEDEIEDRKNVLNTNMSAEQWKGVLTNSTYLLASRSRSLSDSYKAAMDKYPELSEFIYPESQATLQRLGIDINKFSGVNDIKIDTEGTQSTNTGAGTVLSSPYSRYTPPTQ